MIKAFLLTRQSFDTRNGVQLEFWFQTESGPLKVVITQQQALFFIRQEDIAQARELISNPSAFEIKELDLKNFESEPMAGVYFNSQQQFYRARDTFQKNGIRCLESDIRPPERYLTERFLTGPVAIHAEFSTDALFNPRITADEYQPEFRVMSFDIETDYQTNDLFSIAFVSDDIKRVVMIGDASEKTSDNNTIEYVADEKGVELDPQVNLRSKNSIMMKLIKR